MDESCHPTTGWLIQSGDSVQSGWLVAMLKVHSIAWDISGIQFYKIHHYRHTEFINKLALIQTLHEDEIHSLENISKTKLSQTIGGVDREREKGGESTGTSAAQGEMNGFAEHPYNRHPLPMELCNTCLFFSNRNISNLEMLFKF